VFAVISGASLKTKLEGDILKPAYELDQIRKFLCSPAVSALFDMPWMPVYLFACYLIHPYIGWLTVGAIIVLFVIALMTEVATHKKTASISQKMSQRNQFGESAYQNAEIIAAMAMQERASDRWADIHTEYALLYRDTTDITHFLTSLSKNIRLIIKSAALALGAYLVIQGDLTGGMIIAASILVSKALLPIEQIISHWRSMTSARQSWQRLHKIFNLFPQEENRTTLPAPYQSLNITGVFAAPPAEHKRMTLQNITFQAQAGNSIGIIRPSASGKSTLVRTISGVWPILKGNISLDGASLNQWHSSERGKHIGYMPQNSDLFPGTIAENIARLAPEKTADKVISAAKSAAVHDMIISLPEGYETRVGAGGINLSAGQRQRIALARALYGDPFLVVLDEPNSNLDQEGDIALLKAIEGIKKRKGIVLIVAHRNSVLAQIDYLLVMENSMAKMFGPRDKVLASLSQHSPSQSRNVPPTLTLVDGKET